MREKPRDTERLQHILTAIDDILEFVKNKTFDDFQMNKMLKHAVYRNLTIIGEAANLLTTEYKDTHPCIEWGKIIGMRHVLVHGYYEADDSIVWCTITADLPLLRESIESLMP
jgi:uncharacterized protein with HEPN domain